MPRFRCLVVMCCVIGVVMGTARLAEAYVLPADALLKMFAEQRHDNTFNNLSIRLSLQKPDENETRDAQWYFKKPGNFRMVKSDTIYIDDPKALKPKDAPPERLLALLWLNDDPIRLLSGLQGFGIDTTRVGFGRINNQVTYIIGAAAYETDKPQVSLSKDGLLPLRFIVKGTFEKSTEVIDVRLFYDQGSRYPSALDYYIDGKLKEHAVVLKIQKNTNLSDSLFVMPKS
jgi:hypothetical protein